MSNDKKTSQQPTTPNPGEERRNPNQSVTPPKPKLPPRPPGK